MIFLQFFWSYLCTHVDIEFKNQQNVTIILMIFDAKNSFLKKSATGGNNNWFVWHKNPFSFGNLWFKNGGLTAERVQLK